MIQGQTKKEGKITIFQIRDDLTSDRVKSFMKKMDELLSAGNLLIILDLSHVEDVSMLGLVGISSVFNKCKELGGTLKISGLTPHVSRIFRRTNLINTVDVYDETLDALRSFKSHNLLKAKSFSGSYFIRDLNTFSGWERLPMMGLIQ